MLIHASFDNVNNIKKYPPSNLTNYSSGGYTVSRSSESGVNNNAWKSFDGNLGSYWRAAYYNTSGVYIGSVSTSTTQGNVSGEWLQIQLPVNQLIVLDSFFIGCRDPLVRPKNIKVLGSNNTANPWDVLCEADNLDIPVGGFQISVPDPSTAYEFFRIVIERSNGGVPYVEISEWRLFEDTSTEKSYLIYKNPSLYGRFKLNFIALYVDSFNYSDTNQLLYISSPQLNVPGSNDTFLILHEVPVAEQPNKKGYHSFSDDFQMTTELNGYIELSFKRNGVAAPFKSVLLVMQAKKI